LDGTRKISSIHLGKRKVANDNPLALQRNGDLFRFKFTFLKRPKVGVKAIAAPPRAALHVKDSGKAIREVDRGKRSDSADRLDLRPACVRAIAFGTPWVQQSIGVHKIRLSFQGYTETPAGDNPSHASTLRTVGALHLLRGPVLLDLLSCSTLPFIGNVILRQRTRNRRSRQKA